MFMRSLSLFCVAIVMTVAGVCSALAQASASGTIRIDGPWVRESPIGGNSGGGYMIIVNTGSEPDRLVGAESPIARSVELKQVVYAGETLQTRDVPNGIEIPPKTNVQLRWESYYLMFVGLKEPFTPFQPFEASLKFEKAGLVKVQFEVRSRVSW